MSLHSTHLGRFVPHERNVLVLAVVLRPGTCQVGASKRALRGPQLDAAVGDQEENDEQGTQRGGVRGRDTRGHREEPQTEMREVKATDAVWGGKRERVRTET